MCKMLLSINPEYADKILCGIKTYEFRKFRCRDDVDKIIIYSTAPVMQVVGEADIEEILEDTILNIWRMTRQSAGISYNLFRKYYKGKKKAYAYHLSNVVIYDKPLSLEEIGIDCAPQSFRYISDGVT